MVTASPFSRGTGSGNRRSGTIACDGMEAEQGDGLVTGVPLVAPIAATGVDATSACARADAFVGRGQTQVSQRQESAAPTTLRSPLSASRWVGRGYPFRAISTPRPQPLFRRRRP